MGLYPQKGRAADMVQEPGSGAQAAHPDVETKDNQRAWLMYSVHSSSNSSNSNENRGVRHAGGAAESYGTFYTW